ncbi:MAG: efflux RND transporter periplasmic adaptor subunit [Alphaproteobacteria bacterium]|nr:efflux RND transporter periplasmic adaptor subunit [Alphaproteobacteria bacterium]
MNAFVRASLFLVGTGLAVILATGSTAIAQQPAAVGVDTVRVEPLNQTVSVLGRLVPRRSGVVATRVAERVDMVEVEVGDRVARGDVLARLANDRLKSDQLRWAAEVKAARARVARENASLGKSRQTLERQMSLKGSTAFRKDRAEDAERDLDIAAASLASAEADVARAEAQLALAQTSLTDAVIVAPYDGVITVKHTVEGNYLRGGDPVVTMLNDHDLEIEADVPAARIAGLEAGALVEAEFQIGGRIFAVVRAVVPEENPRTRTRAVRFVPQLDNHKLRLAANQSIAVHIPIGDSRDVVTVNKDAVVVQRGAQVVYLVVDGKVQPRSVTLGESLGNRFEVLSGLAAGDVVVTRGNERLRPGQAVKPSAGEG